MRLEPPVGTIAARACAVLMAAACAHCAAPIRRHAVTAVTGSPVAAAALPPVTITLLGTNDLHGHMEALPVLAGYVAAMREVRHRDGGGVVLVDAGDLFQGTLASNLVEGAPVITAYNAIGYDAVAIGNHDFDYGPRDDAPSGSPEAADLRGALLARASEARFPFLTANVLDAQTHARVHWPHVAASMSLEVAGVRVSIIGVTTASTLRTTLAANVRDLALEPPLEAIIEESAQLRQAGATLVIVAAHAGGRCLDLEHPDDASTCDAREEIAEIATALPAGSVDAIVAGHTHQAMANVIHGVPVIESYALGRAFGRIDFTVDRNAHRVLGRQVFPPRDLCVRPPSATAPCETTPYEGHAIAPDARIAEIIAPAIAHARTFGERPLGVSVELPIHTIYDREAPLGNLFADVLREATPGSDVALLNGGGIRADLPAGPLTYGAVYEVIPFDNRVSSIRMRAASLRALVADNLTHPGGIVSLSGVRVRARCVGASLEVTLTRTNGHAIADDTLLTVATSDFLVSGGDGLFHDRIERDLSSDAPPILRDVIATRLSTLASPLRGDDPHVFDTAHPRIEYPGARPVHCGP